VGRKVVKKILKFFRGLRGKLTLTYTTVTVLALLALEIMAILLVVFVASLIKSDADNYLMDSVYVLYPQANQYLQPGSENLSGLQTWLNGVYQSGYASLPAQDLFDSPAAVIVRTDPMYVLSSDGTVLAQTPQNNNSLVGRKYAQPSYFKGPIYDRKPDGNYLVEIPIHQNKIDSPRVGTIVLTISPPPPMLLSLWPVLLGWVILTGIILLMGVAPFGLLFGFVMSRGLTRRLADLTATADAWSEGNFTVLPKYREQDEIGYLGMRMQRMAERIQALLLTRQELAMLEERNRLARELHDTVKQQVFATLMQVRAARNLLTSSPQEADQYLEEAEKMIKMSQAELGNMITKMRPAVLDGKGLADALNEYLNSWWQHSRIPAEFQVQNERIIPVDIEQALYRVAQEALSNTARHSRASAVTLRLEYQPDCVRLVISDNGVGFNALGKSKSGFGLQSMHERMAALGGNLSIESSAGQGAIITAAVPLEGNTCPTL
jgi:two-component system, NarL family, sensor histidine kinase LiaS